MPATVWNLLIEQGATWTTTLTITDRDLTGCTARMQLRETYASPTPLLDLSTDPGGGITIDGPAGTITITISATRTGALSVGSGVYDLELTSPDGTVERLLKGDVVVDAEVTR